MIKFRCKSSFLPGHRVVAGLTGLFKLTLVNVGVARRALLEAKPNKLRGRTGNRGVTFFAGDPHVGACQNESRL